MINKRTGMVGGRDRKITFRVETVAIGRSIQNKCQCKTDKKVHQQADQITGQAHKCYRESAPGK